MSEILEDVRLPDKDDRALWYMIRGYKADDRRWIRYMYSVLESRCDSTLEARMCMALCTVLYGRTKRPLEVQRLIIPQFAIGWCKLDFLVQPILEFTRVCVAVECDGPFHEGFKRELRDRRRDLFIESYGIPVVRFKSQEILDDALVCVIKALRCTKVRTDRLDFEREERGLPE